MRNGPRSNFCERTRTQSDSEQEENGGGNGHIILVEASRRQIYSAALTPAIQSVPRCSILSFTFFIAPARPSPRRCHCGCYLALGSFSALAPGSVPGNIGGWPNAMLRLRLATRSRRANCVALCAAIFGG